MKARKLVLITAVAMLGSRAKLLASETEAPEMIAKAAQVKEEKQPVVAMDAKRGRSIRAGELITVGAEPEIYISRHNQKVELSPQSVAEFSDADGGFRLLRGSAVVESRTETSLRTVGAKVEYVGKVLVSYDHSEKSSSAFVLEGEARLVNSHRDDSSIRLQRFHGATLVVGEVLPQLIRQLDVGAVKSWLKGYSWPEARSATFLKNMPGEAVAAKEAIPKHLEDTKIEDYFSSIDTADEFHQPDYYDKKYDDPDKVVAEQNSAQGASKVLSPEEAALISLPKTQIDLGFELGPEFLTSEQKTKEVAKVEPPSMAKRAPASVNEKNSTKARKQAPVMAERGDPDINFVLERLRRVRGRENAKSSYSQAPAGSESPARSPSSVPATIVPDPVYDYSQNF